METEYMGTIKALDQQITERLPSLNSSQKKVVLRVVNGFMREQENWWSEVEAAAKTSIEKGLKQSESRKTTVHKEVMKQYEKWLSK